MRLGAAMQQHWMTLLKSSSVEGQWHRGSVKVPLTLVIGQSATEAVLETGFAVESRDADGLAHVKDFVDAVSGMPEPFDKFEYVDENGLTVWLEVVEPTGEKPWRYSDVTRVMMRIHFKEMAD